jgi:hypothetical protein
MFYLTCLMLLLAGHSGLSVAIGAPSWGAARRGGGDPRGAGGSGGGGDSRGAGGSRGGGQ